MSVASRLLLAVTTLGAMTCVTSDACAQYGGPYYGGWYGPPYNYTEREHIPYYSLHPPVYYSVPVPRTYGYSPFAYPPGVMTPEVVDEQPVEVIENPYVPRKPLRKKAKGVSDKVTTRGQVIINPFVDQNPVQTAHLAPAER